MRKPIYWTFLCLLALVPFLCISCASDDDGGRSSGQRAHYPQWYWEEGGVYKDEAQGGYVIYTVGQARLAQGRIVPMTKDAARAQAMANMSRVLGSHVQGMITTYAERAGDYYDPDTFSDVEHVENVTRNLSEAYIAGAQQVNAFVADVDDQYAVLMRMDLSAAELLEKAKKSMRDNFAVKMKEKADEALKNMDSAFAAQDARLAGAPDYGK